MINRSNITVIGACSVRICGKGYVAAVSIDGDDKVSVKGERKLEGERFVKLSIEGEAQVIVALPGAGAFVADEPRRVRVVSIGGSTVNMVSTMTGETYCGGPGLVYAEGCHAHVIDKQPLTAVNCPTALATHDAVSLMAIGCERVEAHAKSKVSAIDCASLLAVEQAHLDARDCGQVQVDEGFDDVKPVVHLTDCGEVVPVQSGFGFDGDGCVYETYEPAES